MSGDGWHDSGSLDLVDGRPVVREVDGRMVMLLRQGDAVHVTDALCPHKFTMLSAGTFGEGCVTCPQHNATFDLATGDAGDDTAWAGRLPVHEHRVEGGRLQVRFAQVDDRHSFL